MDDRLSKMDFTVLVSQERERQNLTVNAAAKQSGLNQSTWHRMETGESTPSWDTLIEMARSLGLDAKVVIIE